MSDKFQFYSNSADVPPGKGTGEELVSNPSVYSELRKIKNWRRTLLESSSPDFNTVLKFTGNAELWQGIPRKPSIRREDLETLRKSLIDTPPFAQRVEEEVKTPSQVSQSDTDKNKVSKDTQQRIIQPASEMSQPTPKEKKPRTKKTSVAPLPPTQEDSVSNIPEGSIATTSFLPPPPLSDDEKDTSNSTIRFCPVCKYYLYLQMAEDFQSGNQDSSILTRLCRNCGYREEDKKGGLVSEILVKERSAEGYKILLNEFTTRDYRLPHIRGSLKCPSAICDSNTKGVESDIIYLKDDQVNLTYLYICTHCNTQWRSRR